MLAGCETPPTDPNAQLQARWTAYEESLKTTEIPAELFPTATVVKAYGGVMGLSISSEGTATTVRVKPDGQWDRGVPADGGESLTATEIEVLRRSVFFAPQPPSLSACCIPRHGFVFYDSSGRYLGYLKVCFQCGCAIIDPRPARDPSHSWIVWDHEEIKALLKEHHLEVTILH